MSDPVRDSLIFDQATKTFKHYASEETLDLIFILDFTKRCFVNFIVEIYYFIPF